MFSVNFMLCHVVFSFPSVLLCYWLGGRKGIRSVKSDWWGSGVLICLVQGADLHMAQLMPLPIIVFCSSKSRLVLPFWYWFTLVVPGKAPLNGCCCCYVVFFFVNDEVIGK